MRTTRPGRAWLGLVVVAVALCAASASAAPTAASLRVEILVGTGPVSEQPPIVPNGRTVTIASLNFVPASQ